jgi:hypothetical protein
MRTLKTSFLLLALAILTTSCSGCASKLKNFAQEQIDNVTTAPAETPQGLNPDHRFVFSNCSMTYNEKPFVIGESIHKMVEVFGQYDRKIVNNDDAIIYLWDSIGVEMITYIYSHWMNSAFGTERVDAIYIHWYIDPPKKDRWEPDLLDHYKKLVERLPKNYFKGNILVDNVTYGREIDIKTSVKKAHKLYKYKKSDLWWWEDRSTGLGEALLGISGTPDGIFINLLDECEHNPLLDEHEVVQYKIDSTDRTLINHFLITRHHQ